MKTVMRPASCQFLLGKVQQSKNGSLKQLSHVSITCQFLLGKVQRSYKVGSEAINEVITGCQFLLGKVQHPNMVGIPLMVYISVNSS